MKKRPASKIYLTIILFIFLQFYMLLDKHSIELHFYLLVV